MKSPGITLFSWIAVFVVGVCAVMVLSKGISNPKQGLPITIKGIPENGVVLITPSDPAFKAELASLLKGKDSRAKALIDAAMPFCVFVKDTNNEDLVGCSLQWKIVRADGTTITRGTSHSSEGVLIGLRAADPAMVGHTSLVNARSASFFSLDTAAKQFVDAFTKSFGPRSPLSQDQNQEVVNHIQYLRAMRNELIHPGDTIIVSIDGLILSDGTFFGPDNNQLILSTKALVEAARDLGKFIDSQMKHEQDLDRVFNTIKSLRLNPTSLREFDGHDSRFEQFYLNSVRISIDELIGIRDARGSEAAIRYVLDAYHREWPSLHPK